METRKGKRVTTTGLEEIKVNTTVSEAGIANTTVSETGYKRKHSFNYNFLMQQKLLTKWKDFNGCCEPTKSCYVNKSFCILWSYENQDSFDLC